ncbi:hypothetical protein LCGC14_2290330 [marine sediment metagenome]|uniref:Hpt domain-containing protein n=2 Tax=root TaxID=1 RepID=A0A831QUW6_9FLAO|nr:Hpt domain-containing protein [Pricia antarctica]
MEKPNLDYLKDLAGDDHEFEKEFIDILKTELPLEAAQYNDHITNESFRAASEDVHKIKHKINILGLTESYTIAASHEEELREGKRDRQIQFETILKLMENYLKEI